MVYELCTGKVARASLRLGLGLGLAALLGRLLVRGLLLGDGVLGGLPCGPPPRRPSCALPRPRRGLGLDLLGQRRVCTWACWPAGMSARSVVVRLPSPRRRCVLRDLLPDATPTTAPTVVTAVADATANPRTEIRLTRFPSSIARLVTCADAIVPLTLVLRYCGVTGGTGPVGNSRDGSAAWCSGGIRRRCGVVVVRGFRTPGVQDVPYAGPDRTETLP